MVDDDRMPLRRARARDAKVRFRTLGCYPLTGAVESDGRHADRGHPGDAAGRHLRAPGPGHRPRPGGVDGEEEAGGLLLMAHHASELIATDIDRLPGAAPAQGPAAVHHLRQRRRRQVDPDRAAAVRVEDDLRGPARRARAADSKKVGTQGGELDFALLVDGLCRPSASRASPSTSPTASSPPTGASSSSPTRPATSSTPATWSPAPRPRPRRHPDRRPQGRADPDPAPQLPGVAARHPPRGAGGQQDGPGRLRPGVFDAIVAEYAPSPRADRAPDVTCHPDVGAQGRQRARPSPRMPWYEGPTLMEHLETVPRSTTAMPAAAVPHAGAVGQPPRTSTSAASPGT
jgi:hypothetical protein